MNSDNLIDNSLIILKNLFSQHSFKSSIYKKEKKVVIKHDKNIFFDIYDKELEQNIKEHLKWRNSNRHNSLLKILQKKTYVI